MSIFNFGKKDNGNESQDLIDARKEVPATRAWVDQILNTKLANVMQVGGDSHAQMQKLLDEYRRDTAHYYTYTSTAKSGRRIGRLFSGRHLGIAVSIPLAWDGDRPMPITGEEKAEYDEWAEKADWEYTMNCNHTSADEWGKSPSRSDLYPHTAQAVISMLVQMDAFVWSK